MAVYTESDEEIQYFVPCILRTCNHDSDEEIQLLNSHGDTFKVESLLLQMYMTKKGETKFSDCSFYGFPRGAYCCLAVHLVQQQNTEHFGGQLNLLLSPQYLYSNLIIFQYFPNEEYDDDQEYYVILLDRYMYLEVCVRCNKKPTNNAVYHQIRDLIYHSLNEVLTDLRFFVSKICLAFKCSKCKGGCHLTRNILERVKQKERFHCQQCNREKVYSESVWLQDCFTQVSVTIMP